MYLPSKEIQVYIKMFYAIDILSFNKVTLCYIYYPINIWKIRMRGTLWIYNKNKSVLRFVSFHESSGEILCTMHLILSQMYVQSFFVKCN